MVGVKHNRFPVTGILLVIIILFPAAGLAAIMPDFILQDYGTGRPFTLSMYRGNPVIMFLFDSEETLTIASRRIEQTFLPEGIDLDYFGICINGELADDLADMILRQGIDCRIGAVEPALDRQYQDFFLSLKQQEWLPHYMLIDESGSYFYDFTEAIAGDQAKRNILLLTGKGYPAPALKAVALANSDQSIDTSDHKDKMLFINFWATWCNPCLEEIDALNQMSAEYSDTLEIIGVSVDDNAATVTTWLTENSIDYPVCYLDDEDQQAWGGIYSIPTTFIINSAGNIIYRHTGALTFPEFEFYFFKYLDL
jgi:thiol-disulfide isomerase/thioredoxin